MNLKSDDPQVLLFPSCDRDGLLLDALARSDDLPSTRADAMLFGWMLGLDAAVDAVGAARAVLAVAAQQPSVHRESDYRRALIAGLERFVADHGRVASLSAVSQPTSTRPRRRWRDRDARRAPVIRTSPVRPDNGLTQDSVRSEGDLRDTFVRSTPND